MSKNKNLHFSQFKTYFDIYCVLCIAYYTILGIMQEQHTIKPIYFFVWDLKINANKNAKPIAAAIPPAVAVKPPVNTPKSPCDSTAPITPFASEAPKPMIGTLIPALAKSEI